MATQTRLVACDNCGHNAFKVLIVGSGTNISDHVLVCDACNTPTNLLSGRMQLTEMLEVF